MKVLSSISSIVVVGGRVVEVVEVVVVVLVVVLVVLSDVSAPQAVRVISSPNAR